MNRSALLVLILCVGPITASAQTSPGQAVPTDSQTLKAILSEIHQLRQELRTTSAMTARAQIALFRLQRQDEVVARAMQRLNDARSKSDRLETDKNNKNLEIEQARNVLGKSENPTSQQQLDEVVLPALKSQLELLQKQQQQAKTEEAAAEQQLQDEQDRVAELNDLLDRYNAALEDATKK